jgi:hypothetical protein
METRSDFAETAAYENEVHSGRETASLLAALTVIFAPVAVAIGIAAATHPEETKIIWSVLTGR